MLKAIAAATKGGPYSTVAAKAVNACVCYTIIVIISASVAVVSNSLALRLNSFAALHAIIGLVGSLLAVAAGCGDDEKHTAVLKALGLKGNRRRHHQQLEHGSNQTSPLAPKPLVVADECRYTFPTDLSRLHLIGHFAADVILFFAALSTVMEAFQRLKEPHDGAPLQLSLLLSGGHVAVVGYHYWAVLGWVGDGGGGGSAMGSPLGSSQHVGTRKSPFVFPLAMGGGGSGSSSNKNYGASSAMGGGSPNRATVRDLVAMAMPPAVCGVASIITHLTRLDKADVLVALVLCVYVGQWSGQRLLAAAYVLAARSPLLASPAAMGEAVRGSVAASAGHTQHYHSPSSASPSSALGGTMSTAAAVTTSAMGAVFQRALAEVRMVKGVLEVSDYTVWPINGSAIAAHVRLLLSREGNEEAVGVEARAILGGCVGGQLIVECKRQAMMGVGGGAGGGLSGPASYANSLTSGFVGTSSLHTNPTPTMAFGPTASIVANGGGPSSLSSASVAFPRPPPASGGGGFGPLPSTPPAPMGFGDYSANIPSAPIPPAFTSPNSVSYNNIPIGAPPTTTVGGGASYSPISSLPPPPAMPIPAAPFPFPRGASGSRYGGPLTFVDAPPIVGTAANIGVNGNTPANTGAPSYFPPAPAMVS